MSTSFNLICAGRTHLAIFCTRQPLRRKVGDSGAAALAEAFKLNATLSTVRLDSNQIGDSGAVALAEASKVNATLKLVM